MRLMSMKRSKETRESARVVLVKQLSGNDLHIAQMLADCTEELSKDGRFVFVFSENGYDNQQSFVQVLGTYHRVAENEWGRIRFIKVGKRIDYFFDGFIDEE